MPSLRQHSDPIRGFARPIYRMRARARLRDCLLALLAWSISCPPAAAAGCREVIVSNEASNDLAVIDPRSDQVVARIHIGTRPRGMVLSPGRERVFVAFGGGNMDEHLVAASNSPLANPPGGGVAVVDLATRRLERIITGVPDPESIALSSDGQRLFVTSGDRGRVVMIDVRSGKPLAHAAVGAEPGDVDLSPGGIRVYATSEADGRVSILDALSATLISRISVGKRPRSTAFSPDGLRAYVANEASDTISVLDTAALGEVNTFHLPSGLSPLQIAVPRAGTPLYVSTGPKGEILAIGSRTGRVLARAGSGTTPRDMALSPDDKNLYVANGPSNDLSVFELPDLALRTRILTGGKPWGVVCRDSWWAREVLSNSAR